MKASNSEIFCQLPTLLAWWGSKLRFQNFKDKYMEELYAFIFSENFKPMKNSVNLHLSSFMKWGKTTPQTTSTASYLSSIFKLLMKYGSEILFVLSMGLHFFSNMQIWYSLVFSILLLIKWILKVLRPIIIELTFDNEMNQAIEEELWRWEVR